MLWRPPNSYGCNPDCSEPDGTGYCAPNQYLCSESCQPWLEVSIAGAGPNGWWDDYGNYVGGCVQREYVDNCCDCGQGGDDCGFSNDWDLPAIDL